MSEKLLVSSLLNAAAEQDRKEAASRYQTNNVSVTITYSSDASASSPTSPAIVHQQPPFFPQQLHEQQPSQHVASQQQQQQQQQQQHFIPPISELMQFLRKDKAPVGTVQNYSGAPTMEKDFGSRSQSPPSMKQANIVGQDWNQPISPEYANRPYSATAASRQYPTDAYQTTTPPSATSDMPRLIDFPRKGGRKSRGNLPKTTVNALKFWLITHSHNPYPSEAEKRQMCEQFKLSPVQLNNWFINGRRRYLKRTVYEQSGVQAVRFSPSTTITTANSLGEHFTTYDRRKGSNSSVNSMADERKNSRSSLSSNEGGRKPSGASFSTDVSSSSYATDASSPSVMEFYNGAGFDRLKLRSDSLRIDNHNIPMMNQSRNNSTSSAIIPASSPAPRPGSASIDENEVYAPHPHQPHHQQ